MDETGEKVEKQIAERRLLLKPSVVRLHHIPRWLTKRIRAKGLCRKRVTSWVAFQDAVRNADAVQAFDHHGSTVIYGKEAFVSEPYLAPNHVAAAQRFADLLDLDLRICPNSWWYPGHTVRLIFTEKTEPRLT